MQNSAILRLVMLDDSLAAGAIVLGVSFWEMTDDSLSDVAIRFFGQNSQLNSVR
jgi:hypothetical protein